VSFDTPAHPSAKTVRITNAKKILITLFITLHLLSSSGPTLLFAIKEIQMELYNEDG
jgi:hypothetical protein